MCFVWCDAPWSVVLVDGSGGGHLRERVLWDWSSDQKFYLWGALGACVGGVESGLTVLFGEAETRREAFSRQTEMRRLKDEGSAAEEMI